MWRAREEKRIIITRAPEKITDTRPDPPPDALGESRRKVIAIARAHSTLLWWVINRSAGMMTRSISQEQANVTLAAERCRCLVRWLVVEVIRACVMTRCRYSRIRILGRRYTYAGRSFHEETWCFHCVLWNSWRTASAVFETIYKYVILPGELYIRKKILGVVSKNIETQFSVESSLCNRIPIKWQTSIRRIRASKQCLLLLKMYITCRTSAINREARPLMFVQYCVR